MKNTIHWEDSSWKSFSLVGDEVNSLLHTKFYVFSDSVLCFGKMNENPQSNIACEQRLEWFKSTPEYRTLDRIDGEPIRVEYFPRIQHVAAQPQSPRVTVKIKRNTREIYRTAHPHVDVQRHLMGIKRQQSRMRVKCQSRSSTCKKIWSRTKVISRSWFREKMVFYQ